MSCVYGLFSTKEPERIRYVGISKHDTADKRLAAHISSAKNDSRVSNLPIYKWINKHRADGFSIGYVIIESGLSWEEACILESQHISDFRAKGPGLLNMTAGGEGFFGGKHSEESKAKMRSRWTPEKREEQRERTKNRPRHVFSDAEIEKIKQSATKRHERLRESGLVWGLDVGPKDRTPKDIKDRIMSERKAGKSYRQIANSLNAEGIETYRGFKWYATSIKNICDRQIDE